MEVSPQDEMLYIDVNELESSKFSSFFPPAKKWDRCAEVHLNISGYHGTSTTARLLFIRRVLQRLDKGPKEIHLTWNLLTDQFYTCEFINELADFVAHCCTKVRFRCAWTLIIMAGMGRDNVHDICDELKILAPHVSSFLAALHVGSPWNVRLQSEFNPLHDIINSFARYLSVLPFVNLETMRQLGEKNICRLVVDYFDEPYNPSSQLYLLADNVF